MLTLYLIMLALFLALDAIALGWVVGPHFRARLGNSMRDDLKVVPIAAFYLAYLGGLLWFAAWPAAMAGDASQALIAGAFLGFLSYGTYEFTNLATLKAWTWSMVMLDLVWGTLLSGVTAWLGVLIWMGFGGG